MDAFTTTQYTDTLSSTSDTSVKLLGVSDEEVSLASDRPKKRAGRKKFRETRHPIYRGVRQRNSDRWVCEVRVPNKKSRIWLGTFPTAEMAARAHDVAAMALRGKSACLNFADSTWRLPVPDSTSATDIQKAATEAAEAFRDSESDQGVASADYKRTVQDATMLPENLFYTDEEAASMAEWRILSPNPYMRTTGFDWDDMENNIDVSLWSYSI